MGRYLSSFLLVLVSAFAVGQCANFGITADKSLICAPEIVRYQVENTVVGSTYEWNVGNGWTSGADTFFTFYTLADTIHAQVRITLPSGTVCTVVDSFTLIVRPKPEIIMKADTWVLCDGPGSIEFIDLTPIVASRNWVIDGTSYNNASDTVVHHFVTTGTKAISLVVEDTFGCQAVLQIVDSIKVYPNLPFDFSAIPTRGCAPQTVTVQLTSDPSTNYQKSYRWSFEGSNAAVDTSQTPAARIYADPGRYDVGLVVEVSNGCTYQASKASYLRFGDTTDLKLSISDTAVCHNEPVYLSVLNDSLVGQLKWSYSGVSISDSVLDKFHRQAFLLGTGPLTVTLRYNENGCVSTKQFTYNVTSQRVEALFDSDDHFHCDTPHLVHLNDQSVLHDADSLDYYWTIYDQNSEVYYQSQNQNDSFLFDSMPAYYDVELVVVGNNGCSDTFRRNAYIYQDTMDIEFIPLPHIGCVGQLIEFRNLTNPTTYVSSDSFHWTFYALDDTTVLATSDSTEPTMTYWSTGEYSVEVYGWNAANCRDTVLGLDTVKIIDPVLKYEVEDSVFCLGDSLRAYGLSTPLNSGLIHSWSLINDVSGSSLSATGDTLVIRPPEAGVWKLIYTINILSGCSRTDSMLIYVNGASGDILVDSMQSCAPFVFQPRFATSYNYHFGSMDSSYIYDWSVQPSLGSTIDFADSSRPRISLLEDGFYDIHLTIENATGCRDSVQLNNIQAGVIAGFRIPKKRVCLGDTLFFRTTTSNPGAVNLWSVDSLTNVPYFDYGSGRYGLLMQDSGAFTLRQIVSLNNSCFDTAYRNFDVIQVVAEFNSLDTFLQCAPVFVQFNSTSVNADTLFWDFGDGNSNTTVLNTAGNIYIKNTSLSDGYDIRLLAKNKLGCLDSVIKLDYVVVQGPRPAFEMSNYEGCEPLNVTFINRSEDASRWFLNYNDGSELDSLFSDHIYDNNSNLLIRKVKPSLIVYDTLGCVAYFEPDERILVYNRAEADLGLYVDSVSCMPKQIVFEDSSRFANQRQWLINDSLYSSSRKDSTLLNISGYNQLQLIVSNKYGCADTSSEQVFVSGLPQLALEWLDTLCLSSAVQFRGIILPDENTDTSNISTFWDFGEPNSPGNRQFDIDSPTMNYQTAGWKQVVFKIVLANNCSDSVLQSVYVRNENDLDTLKIHYLSFTDNYDLDLVHRASEDPRYSAYLYQRSDGGSTATSDPLDTLYNEAFVTVPDSHLCYQVIMEDLCGLRSAASEQHCYIHLSVSSITAFENDLYWTHYIGWGSVLRYEIYREEGDGIYTLIGSVGGTVQRYTDTALCDQDYTYYVRAISPDQQWASNSFRVTQRPLYPQNAVSASIKNVTVSNANEVTINWRASQYPRFDHYVLSKYIDDESNFVESIVLYDTFYVDLDVNTAVHSYVYKLKEVDACGYENVSDREGKSILLSAYYDNTAKASKLQWTAYRQWQNGVRNYVPQLHYLGLDEDLATLDGTTLEATDAAYHENVFGDYCYRIKAYNAEGDTSLSNIVCVHGEPIVHIPNAFTPNQDGWNEVFKPITIFLDPFNDNGNYRFEIYNRWGERVFQSFAPSEGWNGTYAGADCQQGAYIYRLECTGVDGKRYSYRGTVTLLR